MNVWVLSPPEPANADVFAAVASFSLEEYSPWASRRKPPLPPSGNFGDISGFEA